MTTELQAVLAAGIVIVALGFFIYSTFLKKKSGCGSEGGCGCSGIPKKPAASQKSSDHKE